MSSNTFVLIDYQSMVSDQEIHEIPSVYSMNTNVTKEVSVFEKKIDLWNYISYHYWQKEGFPLAAHLPMMGGGPLPLILMMSAYLLFVTRLGPKFMSKRPAYELRGPMLIYNILMVVFNAYFFLKFVSFSDFGRVFTNFEFPSKYEDSPKAHDLAQTGYLYLLSKFVDLLDTVFFVLRKRNRQVTTLHVYHHTIVPVLIWLTVKIMPLVPALQMFGILNSLVHTIMYSYYALSAFGPAIQPYLWWKKYITQIQITQFAIFIGYSLILVKFQTGYPTIWFWTGFIQSPLFFYMFTNFYIQSYRRTKANKMR